MNAILARALAAMVFTTIFGWVQIGPLHAEAQFSDAKLTAFVTAASQIEAIITRQAPLIETAETDQQKAEMIDATQAEMVDAVRDTPDITVDEYNQIIDAARADPELAARIEALLAKRQGN